MWLEGSTSVTSTILTGVIYCLSVFVSVAGDVYYNEWNWGGSVGIWSANTASQKPSLYIGALCAGLFIDTNNSLYCSLRDKHKVIRRSLNNTDYQLVTLAGTDYPGFLPSLLNEPYGIFVGVRFELYVADYKNRRVQIFQPGDLNGTTVAGREAPGTIILYGPVAVTLDGNGYLFISDANHGIIIGSGPSGFRTIGAVCGWGSGDCQLAWPQGITFDSHGNLFVADNNNNRIQKFFLSTNSCSKWYLCTCEVISQV